jgi:hypothetical protein
MWYKFAQNENNSEDLALQNSGKPNQPFKWLKPTNENGILEIVVSDESIGELRKIYKNLDKPLKIIYTFYIEDNEPDHQIVGDVKFENTPNGLSENVLQEIKKYIIEKVKIIFPTNAQGIIISPYKVFSNINLKAFVPDQEKDEKETLLYNYNIDFSKIIKPKLSNPQVAPQVAPPGTDRNRSGIGISMLGLDNISVSPPEPRSRQPILPEMKIVTDNTNDLVSTKPVKYPKYNFPINVESLAKSTYNFKAPVEIYIDGVLKIKGHPNQSLYPLYSENIPLSEGIHTLQAKDPKFNTTNTKIMNTQTFTFEVKENQPIKIIKEDPRPGSF